MKLYTYYRSTAAYRVRIALNYKQVPHELIPINLIENQQHDAAYKQLNPQQRVPTLIDGDLSIGQSMAMLEYLEEKYPKPSLLPKDLANRARVRYLSQIIVCDMHPLNNAGSLQFLKQEFHHSQEETMTWYFHWLRNGFDALEAIISKTSEGEYSLGKEISVADICLIPQIYNAFRFGFDMSNYPTLLAVNDHCLTLEFFDKARPENQLDYIDRIGSKIP